jgi:anion-transporting  ArsA/GET3 family ATPase
MMKTRNIFIETAALLVILTLSSFAPGRQASLRDMFRNSPETRAHVVTMVLKNRLDMDEAQAEQALQINVKYAELIQPYLKGKDAITENIDELLALNQKRVTELKTILTPEQIQKVEKFRKEWINRLEIMLAHLKENDF